MFAKVAIFCAAVAIVHGSGVVSTGVSTSSREQDSLGNYAFGYDIVDASGATNSRSEVGDSHGNKKGSYTLTDVDGRARRVDYVADDHGFRAAVNTNEPGTAASAPADAVIASPYAAPVAPEAVAPVAPVVVAPIAVPATPVTFVGHAPLVFVGHGLVRAAPIASYRTVITHGRYLGIGRGIYGSGLYGTGFDKVLVH